MHTHTTSPWSYWELQSFLQRYPVAVLGSGIVGLSAAIQIKTERPELPVLVLERGALPTGASTRNAGFACFGSLSELLDDRQHMGEPELWALVERRYRGLQRLREKLGDARIRYEPLGGFELFRPDEETVYQDCRAALPEFNAQLRAITGLDATYQLADSHLPHLGFAGVSHLLKNTGEGQIHTGEMMRALLDLARTKGVEVLNGIQVDAVVPDEKGVWLQCPAGDLFFEQVLVATNGMARRLLPELEVEPARNQVLITEPIPGLRVEGSFHYDKGYCYFRNIDQRILLGGARNTALAEEQTDAFGVTPGIQQALLRLLHEVILPGQPVEIARWWSGIMGVGAIKSPIVRHLTPHLTVAVRMGGMGVAIGTLVGEEAAGLLLQNTD